MAPSGPVFEGCAAGRRPRDAAGTRVLNPFARSLDPAGGFGTFMGTFPVRGPVRRGFRMRRPCRRAPPGEHASRAAVATPSGSR
ncbi:hypothetical protein SAMN05216371_6876 [Streptomyces sp. TLI_053]|nr:hypothetical protein SAMN05216371_6876 [Streptomyces sp. TLI_053]